MPTNKHLRGHLFNFKSFILLISKYTIEQLPNIILLPENGHRESSSSLTKNELLLDFSFLFHHLIT